MKLICPLIRTSYRSPCSTPKVPFAGVGPPTMTPTVFLSKITSGLTRSPRFTDHLAALFNPPKIIMIALTTYDVMHPDLIIIESCLEPPDDQEHPTSAIWKRKIVIPSAELSNPNLHRTPSAR